MTKLLPCIICGKEFESAFGEHEPEGFSHHPYGATTFYTYGHYGSTFWDSFDGEQLVVCICDACLKERKARLTAVRMIRQHPTVYEEFVPPQLKVD